MKKPHKSITEALEKWMSVLREWDTKYFMDKVRSRAHSADIRSGTNMEKMVKVLTLLKSGEKVKGFNILRTCKTDGHPTFYGVLTGEELQMPELLALDLSLCVKRS